MPDLFSRAVDFVVPDDNAVWRKSDAAVVYLTRVLAALPGRVEGPDFNLSAKDGSRIRRDSVEALRAAIAEHHLVPSNFLCAFLYWRDPASERYSPHDVRVTISAWFETSGLGESLTVHFEGDDKIFVDGLKAQLELERDHSPDLLAQPEAAVSVTEQTLSESVSVHGTPGARHAPAPDPTREDARGWFARTWRDHTAAFVVTVSGGLIAVVIAAVWFGIGR